MKASNLPRPHSNGAKGGLGTLFDMHLGCGCVEQRWTDQASASTDSESTIYMPDRGPGFSVCPPSLGDSVGSMAMLTKISSLHPEWTPARTLDGGKDSTQSSRCTI